MLDLLNTNSCSIAQQMHSVHPLLRLEGGVGILEFGVFWEVKIFLTSGGSSPMRGRYISQRKVSSFFVNFLILKCKISKIQNIFAYCALIFNIHIFRFKADVELQVDIDFNTESKFSCSRSIFFSPLSGHSKPNKPMKLLSFLAIWWV